MSKKSRDYLLLVFGILFVIITIVTSLYASGYKFNLTWPIKWNRLLQKTGMLAAATIPSKAIIYLNDKPQNDLSLNPWKKDYKVTPAKIKNLLPGEYELRFEAEGYWPYKQKINIYSGETTFVEDVNLFKENTPLKVLDVAESELEISPDNKYIYVPEANKIISLKDDNTRDLKLSDNSNYNNTHNFWLNNNKLFINGVIFDPQKESNDNNYAAAIGNGANNWTIDNSSSYLYYQNDKSINQLNASNKTSSLIISGETYLDYEINSDKLFALTLSNNQIKLNSYSFNGTKVDDSWILPSSGHYRFMKRVGSFLSIYDDQNKTLYLFEDKKLSNGPLTIMNINNWALYNNQALIYTNDFEIYIFNFSNSRSDLITRRSEKINDIIWNQSGNYLIFSGDKTLNVFDFKNRNTTLLLNTKKINAPVLDMKNDNLYFWAKINEQEGVYKMLMQ